MKRKKVLILTLASIFLLILCLFIFDKKNEKQEKITFVIENEYVKIPEYKNIEVEKRLPVTVDDNYMEERLNNVMAVYNEYTGTDYNELTDEIVSIITSGSYNTKEEWKNALKDSYQQSENKNIISDIGNEILNKIISNSEVKGYNKENYDKEFESCVEGFLAADECKDIKEYCTKNEISEKQFYKMVDETAVYNLGYIYILEAIAEKENLLPTENELEELKDNYMAQIISMGYNETDEYYKEAELHWESEKYIYKTNLIIEKLISFLYENANIIE